MLGDSLWHQLTLGPVPGACAADFFNDVGPLDVAGSWPHYSASRLQAFGTPCQVCASWCRCCAGCRLHFPCACTPTCCATLRDIYERSPCSFITSHPPNISFVLTTLFAISSTACCLLPLLHPLCHCVVGPQNAGREPLLAVYEVLNTRDAVAIDGNLTGAVNVCVGWLRSRCSLGHSSPESNSCGVEARAQLTRQRRACEMR